MSRIVAIVGRPNVGKSTLFNRLIGEKKAIVHDQSGVTRDRLYEYAEWTGTEFIVIDTGGYVTNSEDIFESEIRKQVEFAINEADLILFMVDVTCGIHDLDDSFAKLLRKNNKPVLVVANKADNYKTLNHHFEFFQMGFEEIFPVSSINGGGTGELLDRIVEIIRSPGEEVNQPEEQGIPKFCIIGKPNVGKSTLANVLLGEDRNIVSDIPGTTRDSIHSEYNKFGKRFMLIDTAGLRKKTKVTEDIEYYSTLRAVKSIDESDVCFLMIDVREGIQSQDMNILSLVEKRAKGLIILLNKWDLIDKTETDAARVTDEIKSKIAPFTDVPILTISAFEKTRIFKALDKAFEVYENKYRKISTSQLNEVMLAAIEEVHPPAVKGKIIRIKYLTQLKATYPLFALFCNHPQYIREPYKRYLENRLRKEFNFEGVPVKLIFKKK